MKSEVIRDDLEAYVPHVREEERHMLVAKDVVRNQRKTTAFFWKVGAVIERPDAHHLVGLGYAKPADQECEEAAAPWLANWPAVKRARERLAAGINPEDFPLFDAGHIAGYNADGSYKPGPRWDEYVAMKQAAAEDDDE